MTSAGSSRRERVALSQELSQFLLELSIALSRAGMYPWGHPSLDAAAVNVITRLSTLLADKSSVSIGVARRQLVIEGIATDPDHPVLTSLAEKLHRHHIGALVFERGVLTEEVVDMLRLVGTEPAKDAPLGLADPALLRQWSTVRLYPLTYEQLELVGEDPKDAELTEEEREIGTRPAQLWIGLAHAALAREEGLDRESTEPTHVAKAINDHPAAKAYDQVIVGYLLQLAEELKQEGGAGAAAVRRRLSRLISALDKGTLQRLVVMGGDLDQRKKFVLDASQALSVDAIVELVQAAANTTGQSISNSMVRLLTKMSAFAEQAPGKMRLQADIALRDQVRTLMEDWSEESANPDEYTRALESLARRPQSTVATATTQYPPEPLRILQMAFEVEVVGIPFWRAVSEVLEERGLATLIHVLEKAGDENKVAATLWAHLSAPARVKEFLNSDRVDYRALGRLLDRMRPAEAAPLLMEAMLASPLRSTRRSAFKRLATYEMAILEPLIVRGLADERWFALRNMFALLNEKSAFSEAVKVSTYARHEDPRVRREALQVWMRSPRERDYAVTVGLSDTDERALRAAILEAARWCPEAAVPVIVRRLSEDLSADVRAQLVKLLRSMRSPEALEALLGVATRSSLFGITRLARRSPAMLAALQVLVATWKADPRAGKVLKRAARSSDPDVRAAARPNPYL